MSTSYKISEETLHLVRDDLIRHMFSFDEDGERHSNVETVAAYNALLWEMTHPDNRIE